MNKKDLSSNHSDDQFRILRRQFRIRSAQKKEQEKNGSAHTPPSKVKTKRNHGLNASRKKHKNVSSASATPSTSASSNTKLSNDSSGSVPKVVDEDPPTEFEKVANPRPAIFAREWHKFDVPLHQLPGNKKKSSKKKKKSTRKKSKGNKTSEGPSHTVSEEDRNKLRTLKIDDNIILSTSVNRTEKKKPLNRTREERKEPEEPAKRERRNNLHLKNKSSPITPTVIEKKIPKNDSAEGKGQPGSELTGSRKSAEVLHCDSPPLVSFDDKDDFQPPSTTSPNTVLVPVTTDESNVKLKPVASPIEGSGVGSPEQSQIVFNKEDELTAQDMEDTDIGNSARVVMKNQKLLDIDKCGNANFSFVEASSKIIDYCLEKEVFKEILDAEDYALFNEFFSGKKACNERILTLLDALLDQVLDNKRLAETPYIACDMSQLNKDKIEAKNNLLDALISKKAVCKANKENLQSTKEVVKEVEKEKEKEKEREKEREREREKEREKEEKQKERDKEKEKDKDRDKDDDKTVCDLNTTDVTNATVSDMNATTDLDNEDQSNPE